MGTKRPHSSVHDVHPDRVGQIDGAPAYKKHKHSKNTNVDADGSMAAVKKRARNIERSLQRESASEMPPTVRVDLERELAALKHRIESQQEKKHRSHMIGKYHMVRFFERKKAQKLAHYVRKKLDQEQEADKVALLKRDLHTAEVDVNYAIYYPFLERYVSLYAGAKESKDDADAKLALLRSERPPMWSEVEKAMESGESSLLKLQNRKPANTTRAATNAKVPETSRKSQKSRVGGKSENTKTPNRSKKEESAEDDKSGDESDTGFFN